MRISRRTIILLVAGLIAAFTAISVRNRLAQAPVEAGPSTRIVIAKHDLSPGTFVQGSQDLDWGSAVAETPEEPLLHEGSVNMNDFNGAVVRKMLHAGDPVPQSALMKSGEGGFMSAVLNPGMRAVSIAVNATSGNGGFISPGDHIDLIVTHRIKTHAVANSNDESVVSETFVRDVRVVAVDQQLDNPDNKAILAKTVTVEVSPRQAEQIAVAAEMGKISLALRSMAALAKTAEGKPEGGKANDGKPSLTDLYGNANDEGQYTRDSDISQLLGHKDTTSPRVHVIRGDQSENLEFFQGGQ